jgi:hypothetical protein
VFTSAPNPGLLNSIPHDACSNTITLAFHSAHVTKLLEAKPISATVLRYSKENIHSTTTESRHLSYSSGSTAILLSGIHKPILSPL